MSDVLRDARKVREQYASTGKLSRRVSIHEKYSVNPQGISDWLFKQYEIKEGDAVLELGAGTGALWSGRIPTLPRGVRLTLTDFSPGMVEDIKKRCADFECVTTRVVDAHSLPFAFASFDVVIANFMLYHVSDLRRALSEIRRVLKAGGVFYAATSGERHLRELNAWVREFRPGLDAFNSAALSFTLQNGREQLEAFFADVHSTEYADRLEVTDSADLADYVLTFQGFGDISDADRAGLRAFLEEKKKDGIIGVTKQSGTFIARKR